MKNKLITIISLIIMFASNLFSQDDKNIEKNNLAKLTVFNGDWIITTYYQNDEGDYEPLTLTNKLKGVFSHDKNSFMIHKYGENGNNDYSFSIIYFSKTDSCLKFDFYDIKNNNVQNLDWIDGMDFTFISNPKKEGNNIITKIEFKILSNGNIQEIKYYSKDNGMSWSRQSFYNVFSKSN